MAYVFYGYTRDVEVLSQAVDRFAGDDEDSGVLELQGDALNGHRLADAVEPHLEAARGAALAELRALEAFDYVLGCRIEKAIADHVVATLAADDLESMAGAKRSDEIDKIESERDRALAEGRDPDEPEEDEDAAD